jgi:predicted enzyme related to lactoylglutathione lyase
MAHPVVHFEIAGRDLARTQQFYREMFDWEIDTTTMGGEYGMIPAIEGGIGGGVMKAPMGTPYVTIYVQVEDLSAALARAESLGGKAIVQPTDIPGIGAFAMFLDPDENVIGIFRG